MLAHGIRRLLTFNLGDFQRFAGAIEIEALVGAWRPRHAA
jgi:hypothetical protein